MEASLGQAGHCIRIIDSVEYDHRFRVVERYCAVIVGDGQHVPKFCLINRNHVFITMNILQSADGRFWLSSRLVQESSSLPQGGSSYFNLSAILLRVHLVEFGVQYLRCRFQLPPNEHAGRELLRVIWHSMGRNGEHRNDPGIRRHPGRVILCCHDNVQMCKTVQRVCRMSDLIGILTLASTHRGQTAGRFDFGVHEAETGDGELVRGVFKLGRVPLRRSPVYLCPVERDLLASRVSRDDDPTLDRADGRVG